MPGGRNKQSSGYTIVEILIVLAVSSFMFVIAASFISGKQERASFTSGSNDMASALRDILDQVTDGNYSDVPSTCPGAAAAYGQGKNSDCVFLGKLIRFYSIGAGNPKVDYKVYSLTAARDATGDLPNATVNNIPGLTTDSPISQNLSIEDMDVEDQAGNHHHDAFNFGFAQGLGTTDSLSPDVYKSGSQNVGLIYFSGAFGVDNIGGTYIKPAKSVTLCITNGHRSANIFLGGTSANSNELSVKLQQLGAAPCP